MSLPNEIVDIIFNYKKLFEKNEIEGLEQKINFLYLEIQSEIENYQTVDNFYIKKYNLLVDKLQLYGINFPFFEEMFRA